MAGEISFLLGYSDPNSRIVRTPMTGLTHRGVLVRCARWIRSRNARLSGNGDSAAPYESHITTSDGKELEVLVNGQFEVVDAREHPGRP